MGRPASSGSSGSVSRRLPVGAPSRGGLAAAGRQIRPCSSLLHVTGADPAGPVRIFSGDGTEMVCVSSGNSDAVLDVRGLPRGIYVLEAGGFRRKIVIE